MLSTSWGERFRSSPSFRGRHKFSRVGIGLRRPPLAARRLSSTPERLRHDPDYRGVKVRRHQVIPRNKGLEPDQPTRSLPRHADETYLSKPPNHAASQREPINQQRDRLLPLLRGRLAD